MEAGYVLDFSESRSVKRLKWIEGAPEKGLLGNFKTKGKRQFELMAHRCAQCGYLIWFAPDSAKEAS
jgi:hypothetical protein